MTGIFRAARSRWRMLAAAAVILLLGAALLREGKGDPPRASRSPAVPVVVAPAEKKDFPIELTGLGNVTALNKASITSQVTGIISSVNFREGQLVKKGALLAQIDPRTFQAQLDEAIGTLGRDKSHLANAEVNFARYQSLAKQDAIAAQMLTNQQSQVTELKNDIIMDNGAIALARTNLSYTSLVAPFDGVTGIRLLDVGNVIQPTNTTGVVVVTQIQPISALFTLASTDIPPVVAALAKGPVTAHAYSQDDKTLLDSGKLLVVNNLASPTSGTVELKAVFPNARRQLWPGTFVNIHLLVGIRRGGITVSLDAVQQGPNGQYVFVVTPARTVSVRGVTVAASQRGVALIGSGLKAGEHVVVRGQYRLIAGDTVREVPSRLASTVPNSSTATSGMLP